MNAPTEAAPFGPAELRALGQRARAAGLALAGVPTERKDRFLNTLAALLDTASGAVLKANAVDLEAARAAGLPAPLVDRLTLRPDRIAQMAAGVRAVAALPDPVGAELSRHVRADGLDIRRLRVPIGVIGIVYESRPNVTVDCAALCVKSGNAVVLRGGKEALQTNLALARLIAAALADVGLPPEAVQVVPTADRAILEALLRLDDCIHCLIPRGGEGLIRFVAENATIPVIKHYQGICALYVDSAADLDVAERLALNGKVQRPGVCNALEQVLLHESVAAGFLRRAGPALAAAGVEFRADPTAAAHLAAAGVPHRAAVEADWRTEFLALILAVRVVPSLTAAVEWINGHGSGHSDAICTRDAGRAERFLAGVDSAAVFWNASTRFHDGFEFGLGAEIGISTDRLHARGPMGLEELCSYKWVVRGDGQVRT